MDNLIVFPIKFKPGLFFEIPYFAHVPLQTFAYVKGIEERMIQVRLRQVICLQDPQNPPWLIIILDDDYLLADELSGQIDPQLVSTGCLVSEDPLAVGFVVIKNRIGLQQLAVASSIFASLEDQFPDESVPAWCYFKDQSIV